MKLVLNHADESKQVTVRRTGEALYSVQTDDDSMLDSPVRVVSRNGTRWTLEIDGRIEDVVVERKDDSITVDWRFQSFPIQVQTYGRHLLGQSRLREDGGAALIKARMPGKVVAVVLGVGDRVEFGQGLVIIESMKMQNELKAPKSGTVVSCLVEAGQRVDAGDLLFEIE